jgi:hypothetical protein
MPCHADLPRVWCWSAPEGPATNHASLTALINILIAPTADPASTADEVCNEILTRGLGEGAVAITILNYGRATLVGNPLDAMTGTGLPDHLNRGTPWTSQGVAAMSAWTDAFIARYQQRQALHDVPAPTRFHMDSELRLPALCYLPDVSNCWGTAPLQVFDAMFDDPRWAAELLDMNPGGTPTQLTMADVFRAAGSPTHDSTLPRDHPNNRLWSRWWDSMMREAVEGAFDRAFYTRVQTAWPGVECSEFAQTMRIDGGLEPDGSAREYVDFEWWNEGWMRSAWVGRGSLQAPAVYVFGETFVDLSQPFMDEQLRLHRSNLDACLHSFGGAQPETVTPWITLPGIGLPFGERPPTNRAYSDAEFLRLLALFQSRGIAEFMVWPAAASGTWSSVGQAIDAVWMPSITGVEILAGVACPDALTRLVRADRQPCILTAGNGDIDVVLGATVQQPDECADRGVLWVASELTSPVHATCSVSMRSQDGVWQGVGSIVLHADTPAAAWIGPIDAAGLVGASGDVSLKLTARGLPTIAIDLVQIVHAPTWTSAGSTSAPCGCAADLDGNGVVNGADLGVMLSSWGISGQQSAHSADLNGDGLVNGADLGVLLSTWGRCPS